MRKRRVMPSCIHKCGFRNMRSTPEIISYVDFLCVFSMCTSWFWKLTDSATVDLNRPLLVHSHPKQQLLVEGPISAFFTFPCHGWQHTDILRGVFQKKKRYFLGIFPKWRTPPPPPPFGNFEKILPFFLVKLKIFG